MPIQISKREFIQFNYNPDYLKPKRYQSTITDSISICKQLGINPVQSNLVIDGGNIIRSNDSVILCDKVFKENPQLSKVRIMDELIDLFGVRQLVFIPWDKCDIIGHADGMIRFIDDTTVLINNLIDEPITFQRVFKEALRKANLTYIEMPFHPQTQENSLSAIGIYLNYLQMHKIIFFPLFGISSDELALKIIRNAFKGIRVVPINCNEIAKDGGILNCISWNVLI